MSHPVGAHLGGIRTLEDLRQRCHISDESGCWHWRMSFVDAYPRVWLSDKVPGNSTSRRMTGTLAAYILANGRPPQANRQARLRCESRDCVNPEHIAAWTRAEHGRFMAASGKWKNQPTRTKANRENRRSHAKLSIEKAREIRASNEVQSVLALRYGVAQTVISAVKLGRIWAEQAPNASVFSWRPLKEAA